jgi:antitoxin VapB
MGTAKKIEGTGETRGTAKLFRNGRSQAVRLPKEFRFEGNEVRIRRLGDSVVLEPVVPTGPVGEWEWLAQLRSFGPLDADFIAAVEEKMPQQERPELDELFR